MQQINPHNYPVLTEIIGHHQPKFLFEIKHQQNDPEIIALLSKISTDNISESDKNAEKEVLFRAENLNEIKEQIKFFNKADNYRSKNIKNPLPDNQETNYEVSKNLFSENQANTPDIVNSNYAKTNHNLKNELDQYPKIIDTIAEAKLNDDE